MYSGPLGFTGCRKLQVCRNETWEMFGCTRFRGNTWMSHPLVCLWVLSASDCLKRALCFSGLNHSGLKGRTCSTNVDSVSWANRQMEVCVFVGLLHCNSHQSFFINNKPVLNKCIKASICSIMYCMFSRSLFTYSPHLGRVFSLCLTLYIFYNIFLCMVGYASCTVLIWHKFKWWRFYIIHAFPPQVLVLMW